MSYVQLTTPLILFADPVLPEHATTKRYVDNKKNAADASWFTSGLIPVARMPALTGDVVSAAGSGTAALGVTGVTAGVHIKPSVSGSGRIVAGGTLVAGDIPNVSWSKVGTGRPTTASGYGITNLIPLSAGGSTGAVSSLAAPNGNMSAVTKDYVDTAAANVVSGTLPTGDVIRKPVAVTPTGFLRCNGGMVDKSTYSALFNAIGYSLFFRVTMDYVSSGAMGAGQPWQQQYDFNTGQAGALSTWTTHTALPSVKTDFQVVVTKNRIYLLGGKKGAGGTFTSEVYFAVINSDGTLGTWTLDAPLPAAVYGSHVVVTKNRVYLLGGMVSSGQTAAVHTAPINTDGTLGAWSTYTDLPIAVTLACFVVTKNRVYLLGGYNGAEGLLYSSYTAPISADGTLGAWSLAGDLSNYMSASAVVVTKNKVYLLSGSNDATTSSAVINADGTLGTWALDVDMPIAVQRSTTLVTRNRVYLLGGIVGFQIRNAITSAPINTDGVIGAWTEYAGMPSGVALTHAVAVKNRLYLIGGAAITGGAILSSVYSTPISGGVSDYSHLYDGSINKFDDSDISGSVVLLDEIDYNYVMPGSGQPWRQQYNVNTSQNGDITGWTTGALLADYAHHSQAIVTKNRVYLLGGQGAFGDSASVSTTTINTDGTLGTWSLATPLMDPMSFTQAVVTKNRVYLIGGQVDNVESSNVYTAPINTDGTLGSWAASASLPGTALLGQAIVTKNRVYLLAGMINGGFFSISYTAPINIDGTLGTWTEEAGLPDVDPEGGMPAMINGPSSVVTKNRVYLLGGSDTSVVYTAPINSDGTLGTWTVGASLPGIIGFAQAVTTKNRVYLLTGETDVDLSAATYSAPINVDGTIGEWVAGTSLPVIMMATQAIVTNGHIHLLGGWINGDLSKLVHTASISGGLNDYSPYYDGTIVSGSVDPTYFNLPDFSAAEASGINYYIKY